MQKRKESSVDSTVLIAVVGILVLIGVIYAVMQDSAEPVSNTRTKEEKRREIIAAYEAEMEESLQPCTVGTAAFRAEKIKLLSRFSKELSMNVFFDSDEKKEIISELAGYTAKGSS